MLCTGRVSRNERQVDVCGIRAGEFALGFFGCFFQSLQSHRIFRKVDALFFFKLLNQPVHYLLVEVVAAEMSVAVGSGYFKNAVADVENRNIERSAAKVVDGDFLVVLFVETVSQRCGGRLIDDTKHFEAGDFTGVFGRLALTVVEVGWSPPGVLPPDRRDVRHP